MSISDVMVSSLACGLMERPTGWAERLLLTGCSFGSERIGAKRGLGQAVVAKVYGPTIDLTQRFARHASPLSMGMDRYAAAPLLEVDPSKTASS